VQRVFQHVPVEHAGAVPFQPLAELGTHEQQLLARVREHDRLYSVRRLAKRCHSSPGILFSIDCLPCTTSSCENGSMKFSVKQ
jgi:hypothetical protein